MRLAAGPAKTMTRRCHSGRDWKLRRASPGSSVALGLDPEDADVAAEREDPDLVLGLAQLDPDQGTAVAEREAQDLDVQQLRRGEVAELVDDHEDPDQDEEVDDGHDQARRKASLRGS